MVIPIILIGLALAIVLGIVILGMTDPFELIILAIVGAFVVQTIYK